MVSRSSSEVKKPQLSLHITAPPPRADVPTLEPNKGNHDLLLDPDFVDRFPERIIERPGRCRSDLRWGSVIYLQDESYTARFPTGRTLTIYGSPWTAQFGTWAFQYPPIRDVFAGTIPAGTDILLTHGPPKLHLDASGGKGCEHLLREIWRVHRSLRLVAFGHIHAGYGSEILPFDNAQESYEKVLLGGRGFPGILLIGFWVLCGWLMRMGWMMLMSRVSQHGDDVHAVRLVNAAVACGLENEGSRPPSVFQI